MPVPIVAGSKGRADKLRYLRENASLRHTLLRERVPLEPLKHIVSRDDGKYFVVHRPRRQHDRLRAIYGRLNTLITGAKDLIPDPSRFSRDDLEAFISSSPMGLFEIVRLHEGLQSPLLNGSMAEQVLLEFQLRGGIPDHTVVPIIRLFDPRRFDEALKAAGSLTDVIAATAELAKIDKPWIEVGVENLRKGWPRGGHGVGLYRISTHHARVLHDGLSQVAARHGNAIPELNDLFSADPSRAEYGTRLGTKPLGRADGAVY